MDNEELGKEITDILYKHTDQSGRNKVWEVDYEEVVKDVVKLFSMHFVSVPKGTVCVNCGDVKSNHSITTSLCAGQFSYFKQNDL